MAKKKKSQGVSLAQFAALTTFSDLMSLLLTLFVLLFALSEPKRPRLEATLAATRNVLHGRPPSKPALRPQQTTQAELSILRRGPPGKRSEVATIREDQRQKIVIGGEELFTPGSAVLTAKAKRILQHDIAPDLVGFHNRVEIAGHAAAGGEDHSDRAWIVAGERALAVMRFLVDDCGIDQKRFRLLNCGDNEPRDPSDPAQNRRVEVIMTEALVGDGDWR